MASALCALVLSPFDASALPNFFTQEGYIVDRNGAPVEGRFNIRVRLYSTAQGGDILFEEVHRAVDIERGLCHRNGSEVNLPEGIFHRANVFVGITIGDGEEHAINPARFPPPWWPILQTMYVVTAPNTLLFRV